MEWPSRYGKSVLLMWLPVLFSVHLIGPNLPGIFSHPLSGVF